ncbi:hypothetical protein [Lysinibacillus piscis]|uniref:Endolytic transglycosylase MltG n=1 Tax=Lysinibacillus piscis TaxID=2518931 RepID=A0ABQ5NJT8_9BACI|nr:hypothetical protein [Lysinibacillus sp. KH24]GLC88636.1 hypothetical protein LYSBPC_17630 [Lysinibacillus sp. KH24]
MNKSSLRAFGIALFLVGALITLAQRFDINIGLPATAVTKTDDSAKWQKRLQQAQEEIASLQKQLSQESSTEVETETPEEASTDSENTTTEDVNMMTLQIYSGMTPYTVAQKLEVGGIIDNAVEMELLLANPRYARSLQIGFYDINSAMSLEEIARLITGKKQ